MISGRGTTWQAKGSYAERAQCSSERKRRKVKLPATPIPPCREVLNLVFLFLIDMIFIHHLRQPEWLNNNLPRMAKDWRGRFTAQLRRLLRTMILLPCCNDCGSWLVAKKRQQQAKQPPLSRASRPLLQRSHQPSHHFSGQQHRV